MRATMRMQRLPFGVALALRQINPANGVRFLFQPAEESFPGRCARIRERGPCRRAQGNPLPFTSIRHSRQERSALERARSPQAPDKFTIVLSGPGGHTARPHQTVDLVADAARVVHELPAYLRRTVDARSPLHACLRLNPRRQRRQRHPDTGQAPGHSRAHLTVTFGRFCPAWLTRHWEHCWRSLAPSTSSTIRQPYLRSLTTAQSSRPLRPALLRSSVKMPSSETEPSMGGEDFANYLSTVPGALLRLGTSADPGHIGDLHSPSFTLDEATIGVGIRSGVAAILGLLDRL